MSCRGELRARSTEAGVALAILVWFLAAMSLLVAGIVMQARMDTRLSGLHLATAQAEAAGDGAIQLALAAQPEVEFPVRSANYSFHRLGKLEVAVVLTPLSGLVDLNMAPEDLLAVLFSSAAGLSESAAYELASSVVEWRASAIEGVSEGAGGRFEVLEDLMMVEGVDRNVFEAVQGSICVSQTGRSGVDWVSAPVSVLRALGGMDEASAIALVLSRLGGGTEIPEPPAALDLRYQQATMSSAYRADAMVMLDNAVYLRRRWVDRERVGADGLPWQFTRTEPVRVVPAAEEAMLVTQKGGYARK